MNSALCQKQPLLKGLIQPVNRRLVEWGTGEREKTPPFPFPSLFFSPKRTESLFTGQALLIDIYLIIRTLHFPAYIAQSHFHCIIKTTFQIKKQDCWNYHFCWFIFNHTLLLLLLLLFQTEENIFSIKLKIILKHDKRSIFHKYLQR